MVLYALGHSESLPRVAARFNIPSHNTVKNWIKGYRKSGNEAFIRRTGDFRPSCCISFRTVLPLNLRPLF
ncbi:helix-turn-helix domain-containing protein [Escherichia coli]|uniref:helix-turn-helix domain-containing protein n=1 Tax=Escherichia coli TaxID=562 RepID=UPI003D816EA3